MAVSAVVDTNLIVSAFLSRRGAPHTLLQALYASTFRLLLSDPLRSVWVYDSSLQLEYQTVLLSRCSVALQGDGRHIREVQHPRLAETRFRSPQPFGEVHSDNAHLRC